MILSLARAFRSHASGYEKLRRPQVIPICFIKLRQNLSFVPKARTTEDEPARGFCWEMIERELAGGCGKRRREDEAVVVISVLVEPVHASWRSRPTAAAGAKNECEIFCEAESRAAEIAGVRSNLAFACRDSGPAGLGNLCTGGNVGDETRENTHASLADILFRRP